MHSEAERCRERAATFLSPDPAGYRDSANLHANCAGDPINCGDPTGEITIIVHGTFASGDTWWRRSGAFAKITSCTKKTIRERATPRQ